MWNLVTSSYLVLATFSFSTAAAISDFLQHQFGICTTTFNYQVKLRKSQKSLLLLTQKKPPLPKKKKPPLLKKKKKLICHHQPLLLKSQMISNFPKNQRDSHSQIFSFLHLFYQALSTSTIMVFLALRRNFPRVLPNIVNKVSSPLLKMFMSPGAEKKTLPTDKDLTDLLTLMMKRSLYEYI